MLSIKDTFGTLRKKGSSRWLLEMKPSKRNGKSPFHKIRFAAEPPLTRPILLTLLHCFQPKILVKWSTQVNNIKELIKKADEDIGGLSNVSRVIVR